MRKKKENFQVILVQDACATRALKFSGREVSAADVHAATLSALSGSYAEVIDTLALLERFRPEQPNPIFSRK